MKKMFFITLMAVSIFSMSKGFSAQEESNGYSISAEFKQNKVQGLVNQIALLDSKIEALEGTKEENVQKLNDRIAHLEAKILFKIEKTEEHLAKYQSRLSEETEDNSEKVLRKIRCVEEKIQNYQQLLKVLDDLKAKLNPQDSEV